MRLPGRCQRGQAEVHLEVGPRRTVGFDPAGRQRLLDAVFKQISDALVAGEEVKVHGFATFTTRSKGARPGRNPKRPEQVITIAPRRVVMFRPAVGLRDRVD